MGFFKSKEEREKDKELKSKDFKFSDFPYLVAVKPREKYVFHSDYFKIDDCYATIMSFHHMDGSTNVYPVFWGIGRMPRGLDNDVVSITFEQVRRMTKKWVTDHESTAESVANINSQEANENNSTKAMKIRNSKKQIELDIIAKELANNAAYLECQFKVMVKAKTLEQLDESVTKIGRQYIDSFSSLDAAAFAGEQRRELSTLFLKNERKVGHPFYFTSTEFAGDYSLVTHGIEDPTGEYVGKMFGDVNNSAVLFAVDNYNHHIVIANENYNTDRDRTPMADYWGSKISQSCLIHNGRVVHIILDNCNMRNIGPEFKNLTYTLDMNSGDVNMFEMFGDVDNELAIFATQMQKLILMAEQAYETTETDRSIIRGSLEDVATKFYIDAGMWHENAKENRHKLRVVGIPHKSVPKLQMFCSYLDTEHQKSLAANVKDREKSHALGVLRSTFKNLLSANGDLFNTTTSNAIDGCKKGRRVIYDFSKLRHRGEGIAMAQLVNIIAFAVGNLGNGDTIIFHGTDKIADRVKDYIIDQLSMLYDKGGRAVFLYNSIDKMLYDKGFSHYDKADYTILGNMTPIQVDAYQKQLGQSIPDDLAHLVTHKDSDLCYLRRDSVNVVFTQDLLLGFGKSKKGARL